MKKIIDGKLYNTETAKFITGYYENGSTDFNHIAENLYMTKKGTYFLACSGGAMSKYAITDGTTTKSSSFIQLLTLDEAKTWALEKLDADDYISVFGEVEEG